MISGQLAANIQRFEILYGLDDRPESMNDQKGGRAATSLVLETAGVGLLTPGVQANSNRPTWQEP